MPVSTFECTRKPPKEDRYKYMQYGCGEARLYLWFFSLENIVSLVEMTYLPLCEKHLKTVLYCRYSISTSLLENLLPRLSPHLSISPKLINLKSSVAFLVVHIRGLGYSNRFTLCRGCTLPPQDSVHPS